MKAKNNGKENSNRKAILKELLEKVNQRNVDIQGNNGCF